MAVDYNFCVGKAIKDGKQKVTQVGVAFVEEYGANGEKREDPYLSIVLDVTLILGPEDRIYLFPNKTPEERRKRHA